MDRGQPTYFLPRRHRFVYRLRVPGDFGKKEIVWTLKSHGKTERARCGAFEDAEWPIVAGSRIQDADRWTRTRVTPHVVDARWTGAGSCARFG